MVLHTVPSPRLFRVYIRRARVLAERGGWDLQLAQAALVAGMYAYWVDGDFAAALRVLAAFGGLVSRARRDTSVGHCHGGGHLRAGRKRRAGSGSRDVQGDDATRRGDRRSSHRGLGAGLGGRAALPGRRHRGGGGGHAPHRRRHARHDGLPHRRARSRDGWPRASWRRAGWRRPRRCWTSTRSCLRKYGMRGGNASSVITGAAAAALAGGGAVGGRRREARGSRRPDGPAEPRSSRRRCDTTAFVPACRMQGTYEWLRGRPRKAEKWWRRSLDHAEKLGARYEGALTSLRWAAARRPLVRWKGRRRLSRTWAPSTAWSRPLPYSRARARSHPCSPRPIRGLDLSAGRGIAGYPSRRVGLLLVRAPE